MNNDSQMSPPLMGQLQQLLPCRVACSMSSDETMGRLDEFRRRWSALFSEKFSTIWIIRQPAGESETEYRLMFSKTGIQLDERRDTQEGCYWFCFQSGRLTWNQEALPIEMMDDFFDRVRVIFRDLQEGKARMYGGYEKNRG